MANVLILQGIGRLVAWRAVGLGVHCWEFDARVRAHERRDKTRECRRERTCRSPADGATAPAVGQDQVGHGLQAQGIPNGRCPNHGGLSTGPRTAEGRARIGAYQRQRWGTGASAQSAGVVPD